jgi:MYXO-CTERM domain-containing protein
VSGRAWLALQFDLLSGMGVERVGSGILAFALASLFAASSAWADAVPPPPDDCPKGMVGTTSHGGPRCEKEPPTDCAPGYRGAVGGSCELANCTIDAQCEAGLRCLAATTCQEFRELHWTGWNWSAQAPVTRHNLFAEAPSEAPDEPPPKEWVVLHICGQDGPCPSPAECRTSKLCYSEKQPVSERPMPKGGSSPSTGPTVTSERPGGCGRGCAVSHTERSHLWLSLILLVALIGRRRTPLPV